jgi:hypothetical protein
LRKLELAHFRPIFRCVMLKSSFQFFVLRRVADTFLQSSKYKVQKTTDN